MLHALLLARLFLAFSDLRCLARHLQHAHGCRRRLNSDPPRRLESCWQALLLYRLHQHSWCTTLPAIYDAFRSGQSIGLASNDQSKCFDRFQFGVQLVQLRLLYLGTSRLER